MVGVNLIYLYLDVIGVNLIYIYLDVVGVNLMFWKNIKGREVRSTKEDAATTVMSKRF